MRISAIFAALFFVAACATQPSEPPKNQAGSQPALAAGNSTAHKLGRRIVANSGFDELHQVAQLDFTFVVQDAGQRVYEVKHQWDLRNSRDRIAWTDKAGDTFEAWLDVASKKAEGTKNGVLLTGPELDALSEAAYAKYINDTYWLMMPLKLFDPGSILEAEDKETIDGTTYQVLRLRFDQVGLTPGDVYRLYIDDGGFRIHRWQMMLQGRADKPTFVTWEDYKPVGPLLLSHRHRVEGSDREILMEGTQAHRDVRPQVFAGPQPTSP